MNMYKITSMISRSINSSILVCSIIYKSDASNYFGRVKSLVKSSAYNLIDLNKNSSVLIFLLLLFLIILLVIFEVYLLVVTESLL